MTITVVIASYKYGHLAAHCIESVLSQSRKADEIIFVDDGAGDCEHLRRLYTDVTFILREKNLGIVDNFNDVLQNVSTDKVMFLGADNWLRSDALELLEKVEADIVTYDIVVTGELKDEIGLRGHKVTPYQGDFYWSREEGHHGSMLYDVKLGQEAGYSSPPGRTIEDWVLYDKMIANGATRIHLPEPLLYYRRHLENYNSCLK